MTKRSEPDIEEGLMALVRFAGDVTEARNALKERGIDISWTTLNEWKRWRHADRYNALKEKFAPQMEDQLAAEYRDLVALSQGGTRLAIECAVTRLNNGKDEDPGRTAANLSRVAQSSVDKLMTLTQRPSAYVDSRDSGEILRSLVAMGVLRPPDEVVDTQPELGPGDA